MAHEITNQDEFIATDFESDTITVKVSSQVPDGIFLATSSVWGCYLTKEDAQALIEYLQSKLKDFS